jgi:hypothetical protein
MISTILIWMRTNHPSIKADNRFCSDLRRGRRWLGKTGGAVGFALNFLWLLSFFQEKESNKADTESCCEK